MQVEKPAGLKQYVPALGIAVVVGLTLLSGTIHGLMSDRWGPSRDLLEVGKKLQDFPTEFGNWRLVASEELTDHVIEMLECTGNILREYQNEETGETVKVTLLVGPTAPITLHTPEICFSSRDYQIAKEKERVSVESTDGSTGEFWALAFQPKDPSGNMLSVYYGWTTGDHWEALAGHRFKFVKSPYLYKVQLAGYLGPSVGQDASDPCREFLRDFMPVVKKYLVKPSEGQTADEE